LEAVQLWNLPGIEQEEEKPHFWEREKLREPTESDRKEKFKRVFEREKVCFREGDHRTRSID
jgi:sorting and assembly machinery component 37